MTTTVAVIGTGAMGRGLARVLAAAGHPVWIGSRAASRARQVARELGGERVQGADNVEAAANAEIVFLAFHSNDELVEALAPVTAGKVVVDIATYRDEPPPTFNPLTDEVADSSQEWTARRLPRARVVGAFQLTWAPLLAGPLLDGMPTPVFVVSDDAGARAEVLALVRTLPFEAVDGGALPQARVLAALYFLVARLADRHHFRAHGHDWRTLARALHALAPAALGIPAPR